jgi:sugar lactone lactonase YvrE
VGTVELVIDAKATLGEGPCWDAKTERLYWVDILEKRVHLYDPLQQTNEIIQLDQYVGAVVVRQSGGLILALQHGFYSYQEESKAWTAIADPESERINNRFNDGKCDAAGRFWAGTMSMKEGIEKNTGALYCLEKDLRVRKALSQISTSNGITWSPDNQKMYYIDSPTKQVVAYDYDLESGSLRNLSVVVSIPENGGFPDGMTIDAEGMLWIAQWDGYQVSRWNPHTGKLLETVTIPAARVTSCVFGGKALNELYITTARTGLDEAALKQQPDAGGVFRVKTNTTGLPTHLFGG